MTRIVSGCHLPYTDGMTPRTNLNVSLTTELCEFVADSVRSGRFRSASEVVRAALRALRHDEAVAPGVPGAPASVDQDGPIPTSPLELRYRAVLESALEYAIIAFDQNKRVIEWNAGATAIMGWTEQEMLGSDGLVIFTREDRAAEIPAWEMRRADEHGRGLDERWHMRADGTRFWGSGLMMPIRDAGGASIGHLKIMQDRTDAHRLVRDLEDSQARLQAIFATVPIGILVAEAPSGRLVNANGHMDHLFGSHWPRSTQVSEYGTWECFHPDGRRVLPQEYPLTQALEGEERPTIEVLRRTDDDARHWVRLTAAPIRGASGSITGAVLAVEDIDMTKRAEAVLQKANTALITQADVAAIDLQDKQRLLVGAQADRETAEDQVRQLQKMEAVGQLTGGIAHDFNNMLAVIFGGLDLAQRRLGRGETDVGRYLDGAMEGATRAASLTQRLLAFSRQQPLAPETLDANRMVHGLTELLTRTLGEQVKLETVLTAGLWRCRADLGELENVVVNLSVNARDAMPEGGRLTIETGNVHIDLGYAREAEIPPGHYVMVAVTDTGTGMPPQVMARAFEPFFTTKPVGRGTGLGLSQVFGFVRQSGGHVRIYSELGHGTTIKIYLPRIIDDEPSVTPRRAPAVARGGSATEIVLVVEDEDRVRNFTTEALRDLGYTVRHAESGLVALALLDAGMAATVLFTDIVMPDMTGRELADEALRRQPGLKVIFTTGYTRNAVVHNGIIDPGTHFLAKPFGIEQLATKLREVLDA